MADLTEASTFHAGIYQIEQTDPVLGGPPDLVAGEGITNVPTQQLADRTRWLKNELETKTAPAALLTAIRTVDGPGSDLNADLLDGHQAAAFPRKAENATVAGSWSFTGTVTFDGGTLYVDPASNRVGIGTTDPDAALHVIGQAQIEGPSPVLSMLDTNAGTDEKQWNISHANGPLRFQALNDAAHGGGNFAQIERTGNSVDAISGYRAGTLRYELSNVDSHLLFANAPGAIGTSDANPLLIKTGDAERMRVSPSGDVGIGTTNPTAKLDVRGDTRIEGSLGVSANLPQVFLRDLDGANQFGFFMHSGGITVLRSRNDDANGEIAFQGLDAVGVTDLMRLNAVGLGIGTVNPAAKLDVRGNAAITGALTLGTDLAVAHGGTGASTAAGARGNLGLGSMATRAEGTGGGDFRDNAANDARFLRLSGGTMSGDLNLDGRRLQWNNKPNNGDYLQWETGVGLLGHENGGQVWRIGSSGTTSIGSIGANTTSNAGNTHVNAGGGLFRSTSSGVYKDDLAPVDGDVVLALRPVTFTSLHLADWDARYAGFIAEEVEEAFPEASADDGENYDVRAIVAALVAKVQSQHQEIADLTTRLAALEGAA